MTMALIAEKTLPVGQKDRNDSIRRKEITNMVKTVTGTKNYPQLPAFVRGGVWSAKTPVAKKTARSVFINSVKTMKAAAEDVKKGKEPTRTVGTQKKSLRTWFKNNEDHIETKLRYGSTEVVLPGTLEGGETTYIVNDYDALIEFYGWVVDQTLAGHYDDFLNEIADRLAESKKGSKKAPA